MHSTNRDRERRKKKKKTAVFFSPPTGAKDVYPVTRKAGLTQTQFYLCDVPLMETLSALILVTGFSMVTNLPLMEPKQRYYTNEDANQTGEILTSSRDFGFCVCRHCVLIYSCCG